MIEIKFTKDEEEFLRNNYNKMSNMYLANCLNRSLSSITSKLYKMGLSRIEKIDEEDAIEVGEVWKEIDGCCGKYKVSNKGRIMRVLKCGKVMIRKPATKNDGRKKVFLSYNGESKEKFVHRLVAEAFIPNPENLPQVNHKDENPQNNCVENLEWCTSNYNANYGTRNERTSKTIIEKYGKPVYLFDYNMKYYCEFPSIKDAAEVANVDRGNLGLSCKTNGKKLTKGFGAIYKYKKQLPDGSFKGYNNKIMEG